MRAFVEGLRVLVPILRKRVYPYLATVSCNQNRGEDFKHGSIYIFVIDTNGVLIFHGTADPSSYGENMIDVEDVNGVKIVAGDYRDSDCRRRFCQVLLGYPAVEGDEDTQSPKLSYVIPLNIFGQVFIVGAGIYLGVRYGRSMVPPWWMYRVVGDGDVSGLTVEVSRSIAGRVPNYAWHNTTDERGRAVVRVMADDQRRVNGMYQARVRSVDGATIARWSSIPIVPGSRVSYEVNLSGDVRFIIHLRFHWIRTIQSV